MPSKTITVTTAAYGEIKKLKRPNESFSELLVRLARQCNGQNLEQFVGAWDIDDEEMERIWEELREIKMDHDNIPVEFE